MRAIRFLLGLAATAAVFSAASRSSAQNCYSSDPKDWPPAARPYFMIVVDSSGSMNQPVGSAPSCSGYPDTRIGHAKCAVRKTITAFSEVNFGLSQFATVLADCQGTSCYGNPYASLFCYPACFDEETALTGCYTCGPNNGTAVPGTSALSYRRRRGANILVPIPSDTGAAPPNLSSLMQWVDNDCGSNLEVASPPAGPLNNSWQYGKTPLNGVLRDMWRYFQSGWTRPDNGPTFASPISFADPLCRSVNVILLTDGDETCDPINSADPSAAADAAHTLFSTGVTFTSSGQTKNFKIPVYVINFNGGSKANTDTIASSGGTTTSYLASNEAQLSTVLSNIIAGAIKPEICDNADNNCNGCFDEGYKHYCNRNRTPVANPTDDSQCCLASTPAARAACLASYNASITPQNPTGNKWLLPCYTPTSSLDQPLSDNANWLCVNPGDRCDNLDNNCEGATPNTSTVDENALKCGGHCPVAETCNGADDNCDNIIDNALNNTNPYSLPNCSVCVPSSEICDGLDNNCDNQIDNGITPLTCGLPAPPNCVGQRTCVNGQWSACSNNPQTEICNGLDDDCNGMIDDGVASTPCTIPNTTGLKYQEDGFPNSQCKKGMMPCNGVCAGWVGPSAEICDGVDNDCNGVVDDSPAGIGQPCGVQQGICTKGTTACVNGALVCQGGVQPSPEFCDGIDNDCNGYIDDGMLQDAPSAANKPCWGLPAGTCNPACSFTGAANTAQWCPPAGATCHDVGTLAAPPCATGALVCSGGIWKCQGGKLPEPETCDGVDNDCNSSVDDNLGTVPCGTDVGECNPGVQQCTNGIVSCLNAKGPEPEKCDGLDNDCDGTIDNGIAIGTPCTPEYDVNQYPGDRSKGECKPGVSECGPGGVVICKNGVGPVPEICDGLDNDCDGVVDEPGAAPDGVDGTANPANPAEKLGDPCGNDQGQCDPGVLKCIAGLVLCGGGTSPQYEACNCLDDDCDGKTDEDPDPGSGDPKLCAEGKVCVKYGGSCQCAAPCGTGEFKCPTGSYVCAEVNKSGTDPEQSAGSRCVTDPCLQCEKQTVVSGGSVECAPAGSMTDGGTAAPVCVCKGQDGCHKPCFGVKCTAPQVCTDYGTQAGKCVEDNCWLIPCNAGQVCNQGTCIDNPCKAGTCAADQVCKPSADFKSHECVKSCASVSCKANEVCEDGACVATGCAQPCPAGQVCVGGTCTGSKCAQATCSNGSYCDPKTGACGNDPCEGVLCPAGQACKSGECYYGSSDAGPDTGAGGQAGSAGASGADGATAGSGGGDEAGTTSEHGVWGQATGGGGCACTTVPGAKRTGYMALALLAASLASARRRRKSLERLLSALTGRGKNGGAA